MRAIEIRALYRCACAALAVSLCAAKGTASVVTALVLITKVRAVILLSRHHVAVAELVAMAEVPPSEPIAHSSTRPRPAKVAAMIPTAAIVVSPGVCATVDLIECRAAKIEIIAVGITGVDGKMPAAGIPIEWSVEVGRIAESAILPIE